MILVTAAEPRHVQPITMLAEEMDRFYGAVDADIDPVDQRVAQVTDALFGTPAAAQALLAWDDTRVVGLAAYSFLWPAAGMTRSVYLKELYVCVDYRRRGVGTLLMRYLFGVAAEHQCSRVEWTTDEDNTDAERFYQALGAARYPTKVFFRMDGQHLRDAVPQHRKPSS